VIGRDRACHAHTPRVWGREIQAYWYVQPFSRKSLPEIVPNVFQIGLYGVVEADLGLFCNRWSEGFLGKRLYDGLIQQTPRPGPPPWPWV